MASKDLKRLNHFHEWRTNASIQLVIQYVQNNNNLPPNLNARQLRNFVDKFGPQSNFVVRIRHGVASNIILCFSKQFSGR